MSSSSVARTADSSARRFRMVRPSRRRSIRTVAAAAVATLVVGIAGTALLLRTGGAPAPTARLMLETPAGEQPLHGGVFDIPMLGQDPAGRGLYYFGPDGTTGAQLMFRSWDRLSVERLSHTAAFGCCVVLSPTGDSIAWETDRAVFVAPITGIARAVVDSGLSVPTEAGGGIDWADDGSLYASGAGGLLRVSPQGGPVEMVAALDTARGDIRYLWPAVLPGSRAALVTVLPGKGASDPTAASIGVADLATGRVDILLQGVRAIHAPTGHLIIAKADGGLWAAPFDVGTRRVTGRERALPDSTWSISTLSSGVDLSLSPTGTLVYARRPFVPYQAVWVDRNGATQPVAADLGGTTLLDPALSHDGHLAITLMADDGRFDVWVKSLDGGPRSRIALDRPGSMRPAWRPDAGSLVFVSSAGTATGGFELFERNADGSGTTRKLTVGDSRNIGGAAWSPDGTWLVLRTDNTQAGNGDILAIRPGVDTIARPVITTPAQDLAPAVSPDGRWIAYSSDILGRHEIFVSPFPEAGSTRYQVSLNGGITPVWRRNGRELFYADAASNLVSVPVPADPGPAFRHGEPTVLFSAPAYLFNPFYPQFDVAADGERFLMLKAQVDAGLNIVVVFNFLEELKRIMEAP